MQLQTVITKNDECSCITLIDSSVWDTPPVPADVTALIFTISTPDMIDPIVIQIPPSDISDFFDPAIGIQICAADLGLGNVFPDNLYYIGEVINIFYVDPITQHEVLESLYAQFTELYLCAIECCMRKKRLQLKPPYDPCDDQYKMLAIAEGTLQGLYYAKCCGNIDYVSVGLQWLTDYCANCNPVVNSTVIKAGCGCN